MAAPDSIASISSEVIDCRKCPRLVAWREEVARNRRFAYKDWEYWGRPLPGFGDPRASLLVIGLAPAAHGGNRTGRVFTGDRSGDWLYRALYRAGFSNQATSVHKDDGLELSGAYVTAAVRCAPPSNRPAPQERDNCLPYLDRELRALLGVRVIVCLGAYAYECLSRLLSLKRRPVFRHGLEVSVPSGQTILCSFHPSQQNTFTGRLTEPMFDATFQRAREVLRPR